MTIGAQLRFFFGFFNPPATLKPWLRTLLIVIPVFAFGLGLYRFFTHQWRKIDEETERQPGDAGQYSSSILLILVICAVTLTLQEYIGDRATFARWFPSTMSGRYGELYSYAWWSGWRMTGYVIIPSIAILLMPNQRWRDYHVSSKGFFSHLWIYLVLFALILAPVIMASKTPSFRHTYPFYRWANRSSTDLWIWEGLYGVQFLALEFFFRGFMLQGLRRALGANAIFIMIVPYCMIHYGKPLPETLGAIGAGILLGTMAMRTRSIWGGVLIHLGVAVTMDVMALQGCPDAATRLPCGTY
jgi:membrane protease YdiL (CAAX protease family)